MTTGVYWKSGSAAGEPVIMHGTIFWKSASGRQGEGPAVTTNGTRKKMLAAQRPLPYLVLTRKHEYGPPLLLLPAFSACRCQRHPCCYILRPLIPAVR